MGFPTKNDHFGVFWGYHHLRKHGKFPHFLQEFRTKKGHKPCGATQPLPLEAAGWRNLEVFQRLRMVGRRSFHPTKNRGFFELKLHQNSWRNDVMSNFMQISQISCITIGQSWKTLSNPSHSSRHLGLRIHELKQAILHIFLLIPSRNLHHVGKLKPSS